MEVFKMKFVGYEIGEFTSNQGQQIRFAKCYFTSSSDRVVGQKCEFFKTSPDYIKDIEKRIPLGSEVEVFFDRYQRVSNIVVTK